MPKSKSAYSTPGKIGKLERHILVVWVDNEAGVLARVAGLFSGRGYNIESLAVAEVEKKTYFQNNNCNTRNSTGNRTDKASTKKTYPSSQSC